MQYDRYELPQPLYDNVNVLHIGDTLIDTGHVAPVCRSAVQEVLNESSIEVNRVIHTHPHIDHIGGSQTIPRLANLPHIVPRGEPEILHNYSEYLRRVREEKSNLLRGFAPEQRTWDSYFPKADYAEDKIRITQTLCDGDIIECGGFELEALSTPGHAKPHLALWHKESGTLFSGDLVDIDGRFQFGPLFGDIGEYKKSLRRIQSLKPDILIPMHGGPISDPEVIIQKSLTNTERTESRLLAFLDDAGSCYARDFVNEELGVSGTRAPVLTLVIYKYIQYLSRRNKASIEVTDNGILMY